MLPGQSTRVLSETRAPGGLGARPMTEESLFVAVLEKPTASERLAFLEEACAGDVALRQRVEQLLAAHLKTLGILDQSAKPPEWTAVSAKSAPGGIPTG